MENNKQQTAVDYYINATMALEVARGINNMNIKEYIARKKLIIDKAKEMQKNQIAKAFDDGDYNYHYSRKTGNDFEDGQEYFNELYGESK